MDGRAASDDDERSLPRRMAGGDEAAFAEAYDQYGHRLYRTALRYLGCGGEAEDAVQDLFVALVRSRDRLASVENLASYLFVALRRHVGRRSRRRPRPTTDEGAEAAETLNLELGRVDLRDSLAAALELLPAEQREVVILKIDSELTFDEIAQVLDISPHTAASRYRYALDKLRARLTREEPTT